MTSDQEERLFKLMGRIEGLLPELMTTDKCRAKHAELGLAADKLEGAIRAAEAFGRSAWAKVVVASLLSGTVGATIGAIISVRIRG